MIPIRRFHVSDKAQLREIVSVLAMLDVGDGRTAEIIIRPLRKEKTGSQRAYWHVVLDEFGRAVGSTRAQMKEIVKQEYYGADVVTLPSGREYEILPSSEDEDREGYGRLIDFTLQLAAEQGFPIRDPRPLNDKGTDS